MSSRALALCSLLVLFLLPAHARAQEGGRFKEEASLRGISYVGQQTGTFGCGAAFADLDEDGDPDLVLLGRMGGGVGVTTLGLYENDGNGHFTDRGADSGIPATPEAAGVSAADYDGDGDLDLFVSCWLVPNVLLRNDGGFQFTDVTGMSGFEVLADDGAGSGSCWGDFDGDGWLDLYLTNRTGTNLPDPPFPPSPNPNKLYRNLEGAGFEEIGVAMGVDSDNDPSFCASFFDYDRDGDADLYLSNDKGLTSGCTYRNRMWENVGGTFVDISASSGTDGCIDAMCVALGDLDGNRYQDIYVSNLPAGNPLYLNNFGDGTFVEASVPYGVGSYAVGWGSAFFDYDNDGWLDLYVCQHRDWEPNRLYDFDGSPPAVDVATEMWVDDTGPSFTCAVADVDGDGLLDFVVPNRGQAVRLYMNFVEGGGTWAKFRVVGEGANTWGVGTNVHVRTGSKWRLREVIAGIGFKSQDDLVQHFGLNNATVLDEIVIDWPGGTTRTLTNYPALETWTLYPPDRLGDVNGDGFVRIADFLALADCYGAPVAPGCEALDMNGDGVVDAQDLPEFWSRYSGPLEDCDGNGVLDLVEILNGKAGDWNRNGVPDRCEIEQDPASGRLSDGQSYR